MNLETLVYIHNLLKEAVRKAENAKNRAKAAYREAEEIDAKNKADLLRIYNQEKDDFLDARAALDDFESQTWHS